MKLMELETLLLLKPFIKLMLEASLKEFPQEVPFTLQGNVSMKKLVISYVLQINPIRDIVPLLQISWVLVSLMDPIVKHLKTHGSETSMTMDGVPREMLGGFIPVLASYFMAFEEWRGSPAGPVMADAFEVDPRVQAATFFIQQLEAQLETLGYPETDSFVINSRAQIARLREKLDELCTMVSQEVQPPQAPQIPREE